LREGLNVAYALLIDGLDGKQRERLDAELYGYSEKDQRALAALMGGRAGDTSGGEG
jgi:hypothetical protein